MWVTAQINDQVWRGRCLQSVDAVEQDEATLGVSLIFPPHQWGGTLVLAGPQLKILLNDHLLPERALAALARPGG